MMSEPQRRRDNTPRTFFYTIFHASVMRLKPRTVLYQRTSVVSTVLSIPGCKWLSLLSPDVTGVVSAVLPFFLSEGLIIDF